MLLLHPCLCICLPSLNTRCRTDWKVLSPPFESSSTFCSYYSRSNKLLLVGRKVVVTVFTNYRPSTSVSDCSYSFTYLNVHIHSSRLAACWLANSNVCLSYGIAFFPQPSVKNTTFITLTPLMLSSLVFQLQEKFKHFPPLSCCLKRIWFKTKPLYTYSPNTLVL